MPATIRLLYQDGRYVEFGVAWTDPDQSGQGADLPPFRPHPAGHLPGQHRRRLSDSLLELQRRLQGRPQRPALLRADLRPAAAGRHPLRRRDRSRADLLLYGGSMADLKTYQISGVLAYDVTPSVKVYGGLRAQRLDAEAAVSFVATTTRSTPRTSGATATCSAPPTQRPEIALRVALTYYSRDRLRPRHRRVHAVRPAPSRRRRPTSTRRSRCARLPDRDRRQDPGLRLDPLGRLVRVPDLARRSTSRDRALHRPAAGAIPDDWWTYNLGVGRQLTDALAGSLSITYEPPVGGTLTSLGPYDGRTTLTAALSYDYGRANITGGVTYGVLGDTPNLLDTDFDDGSIWGPGLRSGLHLLALHRPAATAS